jgi:antitoxin YefM
MTTLTVSEARKNLPKLVAKIAEDFDRVAITQLGKTKAFLVPPQELEDLQETLEILSNNELMRSLKDSKEDIEREIR